MLLNSTVFIVIQFKAAWSEFWVVGQNKLNKIHFFLLTYCCGKIQPTAKHMQADAQRVGLVT